jgi:hypothetical protein
MPLTLFAHQVPTMGLKMARPRWFDGTALCIASMTPDFAYSISGYVHVDTHWWDGFWVLDIPIALVLTTIVRWSTAYTAAAQLPDLGGFRLWSWRVIHRKQPPWWLTFLCCILGAATHLALDMFTHPGRPGARWLGYDDVDVHLFGRTEPLAGVFQIFGHTVGSLVGLWMLFAIGKRRRLDQWYGVEAVDAARNFSLSHRARIQFWLTVAVGVCLGLWWGRNGDSVEVIHRPLVATMIAVMVASSLSSCQPTPTRSKSQKSHADGGIFVTSRLRTRSD